MANLHDYVRWRGDLTFTERPFNLVDNLVLSALAYLDLRGVVPAPGEGTASIEDAAEAFRRIHTSAVPDPDARRFTDVPPELLQDMAASARFSRAVLSDYVDVIDPDAGMQFSAVTVRLDDQSVYVAYRGTDNTILGWQEDFTMSFQVIAAQRQATDYLVARLHHSDVVRVGGHSKGGNLALYAAAHAPDHMQSHIVTVYSNDGPGLSPDVIDDDAIAALSGRVVKVVPEFAVVGALFDRDSRRHVVASSARGLMQHDIMTWQVEADDVHRIPKVSPRAQTIDKAFSAWLEDVDNQERKRFTEAFFGALRAGGASLIVDVGHTEFGSFESVVFALRRSRGQTRGSVRQGMRVVLRSLAEVDYLGLLRRRDTVRAAVVAATGVLLVLVPGMAVQIIGSLVVLAIVTVMTFRLMRYFWRFRPADRLTWVRASLWMLGFAGALFAVSNLHALVVPTNILLAACLLTNSWTTTRRGMHVRATSRRQRVRATLLIVSGVVSFMLATVALSTATQVLPVYVMQVGYYLLLTGALELLYTVRDTTSLHYVPALGRALSDELVPRPR